MGRMIIPVVRVFAFVVDLDKADCCQFTLIWRVHVEFAKIFGDACPAVAKSCHLESRPGALLMSRRRHIGRILANTCYSLISRLGNARCWPQWRK